MSEYIDKKVILQNAISRFHCVPLLYNGIDYEAIHIDDFLNQLPTADVAPVKHGKWNRSYCSACDNSCLDFVTAYAEMDYKPDYCPHCGAKMDL